jgi:hypothetical protein
MFLQLLHGVNTILMENCVCCAMCIHLIRQFTLLRKHSARNVYEGRGKVRQGRQIYRPVIKFDGNFVCNLHFLCHRNVLLDQMLFYLGYPKREDTGIHLKIPSAGHEFGQ